MVRGFFSKISWVAWTVIAVCTVGWLLFLYWYINQGNDGVIKNMLPMLSLVMLCSVFVLLIPQIEQMFGSKLTSIDRDSPMYVYSMIILWTILLFTFTVAFAAKKVGGNIFAAVDAFTLESTDTPHYSNIAENWYRNDGTDNQFMIVFFPLFPILLRIVKTAVRSYMWSALLINAVLSVTGGILFYKLSEMVLERHNINRAVKLLYIFPSAFFFYMPMTEALFLNCTLLFFISLLKKKYIWVFIFGLLASLTRVQGILLIVPFVVEQIQELRKGSYKAKSALAGFGAILGFGIYLLINYIVYGNAFQYMIYQREHWYQSMSYFWNTVSYMQNNAVMYWDQKNYSFLLAFALPSLIVAFGSLTLMIIGARKKLRLSIMAYAVVYFVVSYGPTWLLSGPRYMMCCFPLAMCGAVALNGHKRAERALSVVYVVLYVLYFHAFLLRYAVY